MTNVSLFPPDYPPYGHALDEAASALLDLGVPIAALWDPWTCPPVALPFLAWAFSVDIWNDDWPLDKKRSVIASALEDHRLKGTLAGIRRYVEYAGGEVVDAIVPPSKSFLSPTFTNTEREAALRALPQIRLHRYRRNSFAEGAFFGDFFGKFFAGGPDDSDLTPVEFPLEGTAGSRLRDEAIYWHDGIAENVSRARSEIIGNAEVIYLPGVAINGMFGGASFLGVDFMVPSTATERVYTFRLDKTAESERIIHRFPIVPKTLTAVNAIPDFVAEHGFAPASVFSGEPIGQFFVPSTAVDRIYDVVYLHDKNRPLEQRSAISYLGIDRFGIDPFTAELKIGVPGDRPVWIFDEFSYGFFFDAPKDALDRVLDAVGSAKSARDKVLVNTSTYRQLTIGTSLFIGAPLVIGNFTRS